VSANRPTTGRQIKADTAKAPNASPAPDLSEPVGPVAQSGRVQIATRVAVKYATSASVSRTNAAVSSRSPGCHVGCREGHNNSLSLCVPTVHGQITHFTGRRYCAIEPPSLVWPGRSA
jgi:hypothetical protein